MVLLPHSMQISVIIPCLNEERTIGICIQKAFKGIRATGYEGEVLVADNGCTDETKKIAQEHGARVIDVPQHGYGNAIRGGIASALGTYVVIGDGDDSYDFSVIPLFIEKIESGQCDLVIGNRFTGSIEKDAMPFLNEYLGNPVLSAIGRMLFGNVCGDFHCGLRAGRKEALVSLGLNSEGMEFATEMIMKAAVQGIKIGEVPVTLYKDGRDRPPHLRRWRDGFRHLKLMFAYKFFRKG